MKLRFDPWDVGWRIGDAHEPRGGELWVPWDRTAGVIGPQGSGKTLDLLTPALLGAPGAALVTLTKVEDLLLSLTERSRDDRPCVVLDPFGLAEGVGQGRRADLGPDRRLRGPQGRRAARQGLHRRHRQGRDHRRHRRRCRPVLRRRVREGAAGLLPRRGADREDARGRPAVGRQPDRGHPADGDPAPAPARRAVLARPAARRAQRRRPHRRQHRHHGAAGGVAVLPGRHPPPLHPQPRTPRHRPGRRDPPPRHHLPARPRRPLRLGQPADDRGGRARAGHRPAAGQQLPVGRPAVPAAGLGARRAALDRAAPDAADPDGQRARTGAVVHLGRPDPAPADQHLRRARGPGTARPHQRPGHVRRLQGRRLQPGDLRPPRPGPDRPAHATGGPVAAGYAAATTSRSCGPRRSASCPNAKPW